VKLPLLTRIKAVPKSATAAPGQRPDAETHFDSLQVGSTQPPFFLAPEHHNRRRLDDAWSNATRQHHPPRGRPPADRDQSINCFALIRTRAGDLRAGGGRLIGDTPRPSVWSSRSGRVKLSGFRQHAENAS